MKKMQVTTIGAAMLSLMISAAGAQQATMKGNVTSTDEANGTIYVEPEASKSGTVGANGAIVTDRYKVKDGLLFNALHAGDRVSFSAETIDGLKTITKLNKE
jgi:Cu/Ag efflux protein CusF